MRACRRQAADSKATDEAIALTKNALAALVGAGPDRALSIGPSGDGARFGAQEHSRDASIDLVGRRPDIAAARARVEAAVAAHQGSARRFLSRTSI